MKDFRTLKVWEKSHALTLAIYKAAEGFPRQEQYGLTSQIQRAAVSIPANIAEGCGKDSDAELKRFFGSPFSAGKNPQHEGHKVHKGGKEPCSAFFPS